MLDFTFKKKYQAIPLQDKPVYVNAEPEIAKIDPQLLFQRFIVAVDSIYEKNLLMSYLVTQVRCLFHPDFF